MMELAPAHMQPAPPPMPQAAPVPNDPHNALLDAIKGGSKLKASYLHFVILYYNIKLSDYFAFHQPVDSEQRPKPIVDTRHDLLSEIRSGVALKPVNIAYYQGSPKFGRMAFFHAGVDRFRNNS